MLSEVLTHHPLVPEGLEAPLTDGADRLDCTETIVGHENFTNGMVSSAMLHEFLDAIVEPAGHPGGRGVQAFRRW